MHQNDNIILRGNMKHLSTFILGTLFLLGVTYNCNGKSKNNNNSVDSKWPFSKISSAKHIFGPEVTQDDLKGKVVFLEYWGINCPPCRASFPHLVELQQKYAKTGKFTVLASHRQDFSNEVKPFLSKNKVTFPVYQFFDEPAAPCGRGIPHAALFDYKGKLISSGYPSDLYPLVAKLVKEVPPPIIAFVEVKYCKSQAQALGSGRPVLSTLKALEKIAAGSGPKAEEAKQLVDAANTYLEKRKNKLLELANNKPSQALVPLASFVKITAGLPVEKEARAKLTELKKDGSLKKFIRIRAKIDKLAAKLEKRNSSSTKRALDAAKQELQKFIDSNTLSDAVAKEAKELLE